MSKNLEPANLIDLNFEDEEKLIKLDEDSSSSNAPAQFVPPYSLTPLVHQNANSSLIDNNPFDSVHKLSARIDDPFDIVENEAFKAMRHEECEVEVGNLLSISDDDIKDVNPNLSQTTELQQSEKIVQPQVFACKYGESSDSGTDSVSSAETSSSCSSKVKKSMEYRRRLLKMSLSNAIYSTPITRKQKTSILSGDEGSASEKDNQSPLSSIFFQAAQNSDQLLAAESPIQLISDDLLSDSTMEDHEKLKHLETDYDADLEMMQLPILKELPSAMCSKTPALAEKFDTAQTKSPIMADLEKIRSKLQAQRQQNNNPDAKKNVVSLIQNLKSMIADIGELDENENKEAKGLLETLSNVLGSTKIECERPALPRQNTFDLDLEKKSGRHAEIDSMRAGAISPISNQMAPLTNMTSSTYSTQSIPDVMFKSSATYDNEPIDERRDYALPQVASSSSPPTLQSEENDPNLNDIIERVAELLGQNQITKQQPQSNGSTEECSSNSSQQQLNPTFIVVMNTSVQPSPSKRDCNTTAMTNESFTVQTQMPMRRRSQSWSLHDKIKIVQVSLPPTNYDDEQYESPPATVDPDSADFKTPMRMIARRNSFSNGTPLSSHYRTADATPRRSHIGTETIPRSTQVQHKRLTTHHEQQQGPLPIPRTTYSAFKPDLKRKTGSAVTSSVIASTGPMKATIPVKKVAPMIKTISPPIQSDGCAAKAYITQTSTPMPRGAATYPSISSAHSSPTNRNRLSMNKSRYSHNAANPTPVRSISTKSPETATLKRRTLTDVSVKTTRLSTNAPGSTLTNHAHSVLKTPKNPVSSVYSSRTVSKPAGSRTVVRSNQSGPTLKRNKENKGP